MRRLAATLMVVVANLSIPGCTNGVQPTEASIAGTWSLTSINGVALPATVQATNPKIEILYGAWVIVQGGSMKTTTIERHTVGTTVEQPYTYTDNPGYLLIESEITLVYPDGTSLIGDISGNRITIKINGYTEVYEKQPTT